MMRVRVTIESCSEHYEQVRLDDVRFGQLDVDRREQDPPPAGADE